MKLVRLYISGAIIILPLVSFSQSSYHTGHSEPPVQVLAADAVDRLTALVREQNLGNLIAFSEADPSLVSRFNSVFSLLNRRKIAESPNARVNGTMDFYSKIFSITQKSDSVLMVLSCWFGPYPI